MMLDARLAMLRTRACWALVALGPCALSGCGPGTATPESRAEAARTARALVRPLLSRSALSAPASPVPSGTSVSPGPTLVVLGHRAPDGTLRVGCVDTEDGAEALVRGPDEDR